MKVPVFTHPACLQHDPGPGHPETPARLRVLLERLRAEPGLDVREAAAATIDDVAVVHPRDYLASVEELSRKGGGPIFLDTVLNQFSWQAALGASGAALAAQAREGHPAEPARLSNQGDCRSRLGSAPRPLRGEG